MTSREIIKKLEKEGWVLSRIKGSHHQFKHPYKKGIVSVPHPRKDFKPGTFANIKRQAGW